MCRYRGYVALNSTDIILLIKLIIAQSFVFVCYCMYMLLECCITEILKLHVVNFNSAAYLINQMAVGFNPPFSLSRYLNVRNYIREVHTTMYIINESASKSLNCVVCRLKFNGKPSIGTYGPYSTKRLANREKSQLRHRENKAYTN